MSSFQTAGSAAMNSPIIRTSSGSLSTTTSVPCSASQSCPPVKLRSSPTTTRRGPNGRTRPEQYQHGESVVALLHPTVPPGSEQAPVGVEQGGADRDAALGQPEPGLLRGDRQLLRVRGVPGVGHAALAASTCTGSSYPLAGSGAPFPGLNTGTRAK